MPSHFGITVIAPCRQAGPRGVRVGEFTLRRVIRSPLGNTEQYRITQMAVIKLQNKNDVEEFSNVVKLFGTLLDLTKQLQDSNNKFNASRLETAQFWNQYAIERASDKQLRTIASNDLVIVQNQIDSTDDFHIDMIEKIKAFFEKYKVEC